MTKISLKVLITRPEKSGRALAESLLKLGIATTCQPMFDYQKSTDTEQIPRLLQTLHQPIVIFVSVAAVEYANQIQPISTWHYQNMIAIGSATQSCLEKLGHSAICPSMHTSEGLLALNEMQSLKGKNIIIVRGDGGLETIAQAIINKGGIVDYFESYQRKWRTFNNDIANYWQKSGVNCIVITSNALLKQMISLLSPSNDHWQNECLWLVASQRISDQAQELGLMKVFNTHGANDEAIIHAINQYGIADDK